MTKKRSLKSAAHKKPFPASPADVRDIQLQLAELLAGEEEGPIVTKGDWEALTASLSGPSAYDQLSDKEADARNEARQIAFDAMEAETQAQARKLAKRALRLDPDCVDALLLMIDLDARTPRAIIEGLQTTVAAGERSLGERFIQENRGHFWLLLETRPYMRALQCLAEAYRTGGLRNDAVRTYEKMLELNPNDNQGVRDPLLGLHLEAGDVSAAALLLGKYKEDGSANFAWARVLKYFLKGDRRRASAALVKARRENRYVELFLTARKPLPREPPDMYAPGSEEEAVLCLSFLGGAWAEHKEALHWLFAQLEADGPRLPAKKTVSRKLSSPGSPKQ